MKLTVKKPRWTKLILSVGLVVGFLMAIGTYRYLAAPLEVLPVTNVAQLVQAASQPSLTWPAYGQAAVAAEGFGVVATHGDKSAQPTASTAKLITLLAVLDKKPMEKTPGAKIVFDQGDVESYQRYVAGNGSVTRVEAELEWTQYQAFQAVLLASSNNVSDSLAIWAFGSLENYRQHAQVMVKKLGMNDTVIGVDASGYDSSTVSTAHDMALLGLAAAKQPVLREIAAQTEANLPFTGTVHNTNKLLNDSAIDGLKTGFINESGGVFVLSGRHHDGDHSLDIVTVVMGAPGEISAAARQAQQDASQLFKSAKTGFQWQEFVEAGQKVGEYQPPWLKEPKLIIAGESVSGFRWLGDELAAKAEAQTLHGAAKGTVGELLIEQGSEQRRVPLRLDDDLPPPSLWWRIIN